MTEDCSLDVPLLLRAALSEDESEAHAAWRSWRGSGDVQHISWPALQLIPLLNGPRFHDWLAGDPDAGILQGIVRRAWTEAQVRLALAHEAAAQLERTGCDPVVLIGPAAVYLRTLCNRRAGVRPISEIRLLIGRPALPAAANALQAAGWKLQGELPAPKALDWSMFTSFSQNGVALYLHWRALPVSGAEAPRCEREFLAHHEVLEARAMSFRVLACGHALLAALAGRTASGDADVVPWQVDAALIPRDEIVWNDWSRLASAFGGEAIGKLAELRALGVSLPKIERPSLGLRARILRVAKFVGRYFSGK
jgi:hypothetical protein